MPESFPVKTGGGNRIELRCWQRFEVLESSTHERKRSKFNRLQYPVRPPQETQLHSPVKKERKKVEGKGVKENEKGEE